MTDYYLNDYETLVVEKSQQVYKIGRRGVVKEHGRRYGEW